MKYQKVEAHELDPNKRYIIQMIADRPLTEADIAKLQEQMKKVTAELGVQNVVIVTNKDIRIEAQELPIQ